MSHLVVHDMDTAWTSSDAAGSQTWSGWIWAFVAW